MKVTWANLQAEGRENLLELLHREADGDLTPAERASLDRHQDDPQLQSVRAALSRAVTWLSGPNPPLPRSVASDVVADMKLAQQLQAPALTASLASAVVSEIQAAQLLKDSPALPHSVAALVTADIGLARTLAPPRLPASLAAAVVADLQAAQALQTLSMPRSVAASVSARIAAHSVPEWPQAPDTAHTALHQTASDEAARVQAAVPSPPVPAPALSLQTSAFQTSPVRLSPGRNPAPMLLVLGLLAGLTLLAATTAWPNLAAGATVLRTLLTQVSPLAGLGLLLLILTSLVITWKPTPTLRTAGMGAYALAAILSIPALYNVAGGQGGLSIGRNVAVSGPVSGNVIAIGGNVHLHAGARVQGEVVTLLGDVQRDPGAQVGGRVNALLGHAPDDAQAIQTQPVTGLSLATAAAFRPVLGWLGAAAWPQIFVALTGALLLLLFLGGTAPVLARRQRHAPMRTLALGVLLLSALTLPAVGFGLVGFLGPALVAAALTALLVATGLSVSVYDAGRALACRLKLPVPDAVGAMIGLCTFAASLSVPPLAFALALIGGTWGAGTLFLTRNLRLNLPA